jgi:hypothetical protein
MASLKSQIFPLKLYEQNGGVQASRTYDAAARVRVRYVKLSRDFFALKRRYFVSLRYVTEPPTLDMALTDRRTLRTLTTYAGVSDAYAQVKWMHTFGAEKCNGNIISSILFPVSMKAAL